MFSAIEREFMIDPCIWIAHLAPLERGNNGTSPDFGGLYLNLVFTKAKPRSSTSLGVPKPQFNCMKTAAK